MFDRVGRNVFWNWIGLAVAMAVAFFLSPFLVHTLGDAQYGLWVLILSLTGYMAMLDGGLKVSVVKFVAALSEKGDDEALGSVVSTTLAIYVLLAVVLMSVATLAGPMLERLFEMPAALRDTARKVLVIASGTLSVTLLASVFNGFFAGLQRYDITNKVQVGTTLVAASAIYLTVSAGLGIVGLALVYLGVQATAGLALWRLALRLRPGLRVGPALVRFATLRQLYGYSAFVLLNSLAMLLLFRSGELVAGFLFGTAAVTYFAIGGMLVEYLGKIIGSMTQVLHPLASSRYALGDESGLREAVLLSTRVCIAIALPACIGFIVLGGPFLAAWMGPSYAAVSAPILGVLAVGRLFWLAQSGAGNILLGGGRHRALAILTSVTGLAGIALAAAFGMAEGLIGVAVGLTTAIVGIYGLALPIYVCRSLDIGILGYLRGALLGPAVAAVPYTVTLLLLSTWLRPQGFGPVLLVAAIAIPLYLAVAWVSCLEGKERQALAGLLRRRRVAG